MGGYSAGQNEDIDKALESWPKICKLIQQGEQEKTNYNESINQLYTIK